MFACLRRVRFVRWIAYPALLIFSLLIACSHIEPQRVHGDQALAGDKLWNFVHPLYNVEWKAWGKALYWIGPGH